MARRLQIRIGAYSYDFAFAMKVPKNQAPQFSVIVQGNFNQPYCDIWFLTCLDTDNYYSNPSFSSSQSFSMPPVTTITSSPAGAGFVQVDSNSVTSPAEFIWNPGDSHTISASSVVQGNLGVRYIFTGWSDGGAQSHEITASSSQETITANFGKQYELNVSQPNGGFLTLPYGQYWYNDSHQLTVQY